MHYTFVLDLVSTLDEDTEYRAPVHEPAPKRGKALGEDTQQQLAIEVAVTEIVFVYIVSVFSS